MHKILLIDDDVDLTSMLKEYLVAENFEVEIANDGVNGAQYALSGRFDLVVLDVMMPELNGIETLRLIREKSHIPVIMLTAKGDEGDRFHGLELGADDYIPKPCTPRELVARIRAILRRIKYAKETEEVPEEIKVGALTLWPPQRKASWKKHALNLTSTEYSVLEILAKNAGQPVTKEDVSLHAIGRPLTRFDRSVDVHISSVRQKISAFSKGDHGIQTVYRIGYQLIKE